MPVILCVSSKSIKKTNTSKPAVGNLHRNFCDRTLGSVPVPRFGNQWLITRFFSTEE